MYTYMYMCINIYSYAIKSTIIQHGGFPNVFVVDKYNFCKKALHRAWCNPSVIDETQCLLVNYNISNFVKNETRSSINCIHKINVHSINLVDFKVLNAGKFIQRFMVQNFPRQGLQNM